MESIIENTDEIENYNEESLIIENITKSRI